MILLNPYPHRKQLIRARVITTLCVFSISLLVSALSTVLLFLESQSIQNKQLSFIKAVEKQQQALEQKIQTRRSAFDSSKSKLINRHIQTAHLLALMDDYLGNDVHWHRLQLDDEAFVLTGSAPDTSFLQQFIAAAEPSTLTSGHIQSIHKDKNISVFQLALQFDSQ